MGNNLSMNTTKKQLEKRAKQDELLKMFGGDFYQEKEMPDCVYIKMWNGGTGRWQVAKFSLSGFRKYRAFLDKNKYNYPKL